MVDKDNNHNIGKSSKDNIRAAVTLHVFCSINRRVSGVSARFIIPVYKLLGLSWLFMYFW